jgi:hypothetical protein
MPRRKSESELIPLEHAEAVELAKYFRSRGLLFSHIANETSIKNWGYLNRMKRIGKNRGVPDYVVIVRDRLVFIELKRIKKSIVKPEQITWIDALNKCPGVHAFIAYGAADAVEKFCAHESDIWRGVDKS